MVFRVGRHNPRIIYWQHGNEPADTDPMVGVMDAPELAAGAVTGLNWFINTQPTEAPKRADRVTPNVRLAAFCPSRPLSWRSV